jgi:uncharacterized protein (DUF736 family)
MAFEQKANSGAMFRNEKKNSPNHPDMRGDIHLDRTFLINLMHKNSDPLIKVSISGWSKESAAGKKYLSLSASEPWEGGQAAPRAAIPDDELPY